jgi:hypothetical protein
MINARVKELMLAAGYAAPEFAERAQELTKLIVNDIIEIMSDPINYNRCTFTTFDESQAKCVASELAIKINQHFGIEK